MNKIFLIFLGGGIGSIARFLLGNILSKNFYNQSFPWATFSINILGSFLIGIFIFAFGKDENSLKFLLITGFCGGFTTFSTFSAENYQLFQNGNYITLFSYVLVSVVLGFLAVLGGYQIAKLILLS